MEFVCPTSSVVIKLLRSEYPSVVSLIEFRNQYRITKNLNISGIVPILDLEPYSNGFALIMEDQGYVSLADYWVIRELTFGELLRIAIEITRILEQLYQHRIIHKDVKLQNILVHPETLKIQLIDFSISTQFDRQNQEFFNSQGLEGTLAYMSPEQTGRTHRGIDYRTDLYSLGVTLYQLFTRKLPFQSSEPLELIHAHLALLPLPLVEIRPSLPLMLNNIILKLMAKNPEARYQTPSGLLHDLELCLEQWETIGDIPLFPLASMDLNDRFIIPDKFYGRESELAHLSSIFPEIQSRIIVITGQSGIGKSSLVQEFYQKTIQNQAYFISGKFDQFRNNTPFWGWVQGIKQLIQQILTETPAKVEDWKTKLMEALGEKTQILVDVIPELKSLLNQQVLTPELEANLDQNQFNRLILRLIQVFAQPPHPLIIFLDDLQWADIESLRLIQVLMSPENSSQSLVLILAYRDQEIGETHPLRETLKTLENLGIRLNRLF